MDQSTNPPERTGLPANGTPGDQGEVAAEQTQDDFDSRLQARITEAQDKQFRNIQGLMDRRFRAVEQQNQQLAAYQQTVQQRLDEIGGYFRQAEDANLDPEQRQAKDLQRELTKLRQERDQAAQNAHQQRAWGMVLQALGNNEIKPGDTRLDWHEELMRSDPYQWVAVMATQAADLRRLDVENRLAAQTQVRVDSERRRGQVQGERDRVQTQNARQQDLADTMETATPTGEQANWNEQYQYLLRTDPQKAESFIRGLARQVTRNGAKNPTDLRFRPVPVSE